MIYLVIVIFLLCGLFGFELYLSRQERNKLINAILTKTPEQLAGLISAEKVRPIKADKQPDMVAEDSLSEEQLLELIKKDVV